MSINSSSDFIGCDYNCQREKNILELKQLYNKELNFYYDLYNQYLKYRFNHGGGKNSYWKINYAESQIKPKVAASNKRLNKILNELKGNIDATNSQISKQTAEIKEKTMLIHDKNRKILVQDQDIDEKQDMMDTKDGQIEFGSQRNFYKRNVMYLLIVLNVIVLSVISALIYKSQ